MNLAYFIKGARSAETMRKRLRWSGFTINGKRIWTEEERTILRLFHPHYGLIKGFLPDRSEAAIRAQCRAIGLTYSIHVWSYPDITKLRRLYPSASKEEICQAFPHSNWTNICATARRRGLRRKKKPYKITGIAALDQFRTRCYDVNWTMRDADEEAGTKRYFQTRGYRSNYPNYRAISRGVKALGGHLEVCWDE